jgi:hypothetical protein
MGEPPEKVISGPSEIKLKLKSPPNPEDLSAEVGNIFIIDQVSNPSMRLVKGNHIGGGKDRKKCHPVPQTPDMLTPLFCNNNSQS